LFSIAVVEKPEDNIPKWDWRSLFRRVVPDVSKGLENHLQTLASTQLFVEWDSLEHGTKTLQAAPVDPKLVGGRLDYPRRISKVRPDCLLRIPFIPRFLQGLQELVVLLQACMPLATAGTQSCFVLLRSSFVDALLMIFKNLVFKIAKVLLQVYFFSFYQHSVSFVFRSVTKHYLRAALTW
jgi:hypothetical protein